MTQRGFPFDAGEGLAYELDWSLMAKKWRADGIIQGVGTELAVFADSTGMQVKVPAGDAWIRGHYYRNDAQVTQAIAAANATNPRIDRIVLRIDYAANTIRIAAITGVAAPSPAAPAVTQNDAIYEYSLATVLVDAAVGTIAAGKVTNTRNYSTSWQPTEYGDLALSGSSLLTGNAAVISQSRTGAVVSNHQLLPGAQGVSNQYGLYNVTAARYEWYTTSAGIFTAVNGLAVPAGGANITGGVALTTGSLSFGGTGQRITGDFTNATHANRVLFQTSTVNSNTVVGVLPNGSGTASQIILYSLNDPANTPTLSLTSINTGAQISSGSFGTGAAQSLSMIVNGVTLQRYHVSGGVSYFGTTDPGANVLSIASGALQLNAAGASIRNTTAGGYIGIQPNTGGFLVINNAGSANNLAITDAGAATFRLGVTINGPSLALNSGNFSVSGAVTASAVNITSTVNGSANDAYSMVVQTTAGTGISGSLYGVFTRHFTPNSFTTTNVYAFYAASPILGTSNSITTNYGVYVASMAGAGITGSYGVYVAAGSSFGMRIGAQTNYGLYIDGGSTNAIRIAGATSWAFVIDAGGANISGGASITGGLSMASGGISATGQNVTALNFSAAGTISAGTNGSSLAGTTIAGSGLLVTSTAAPAVDVSVSQNSTTQLRIINGSSGASASAVTTVTSDAGTIAMYALSSTYGSPHTGRGLIQSSHAAGINIQVTNGGDIRFYGGSGGTVEMMRFFNNSQATFTGQMWITNSLLVDAFIRCGPNAWGSSNGDINCVRLYRNGTALDFVFEPEYKLMPIPEMRAYYEREKHLPTIPTREIMAAGAVDEGGLTDRLWETSEVHARYIADLHSQINDLRAEIATLRAT